MVSFGDFINEIGALLLVVRGTIKRSESTQQRPLCAARETGKS
jgi:hypothetical protein